MFQTVITKEYPVHSSNTFFTYNYEHTENIFTALVKVSEDETYFSIAKFDDCEYLGYELLEENKYNYRLANFLDKPTHVLINIATYSDYSSGLHSKCYSKICLESFSGKEFHLWLSHGLTYTIIPFAELKSFLDDYKNSFDLSDIYSELENELEVESFNDWIKRNLQDCIAKKMYKQMQQESYEISKDDIEDNLNDAQWQSLYNELKERSNEYFVCESPSGGYIDVEKLVQSISVFELMIRIKVDVL